MKMANGNPYLVIIFGITNWEHKCFVNSLVTQKGVLGTYMGVEATYPRLTLHDYALEVKQIFLNARQNERKQQIMLWI